MEKNNFSITKEHMDNSEGIKRAEDFFADWVFMNEVLESEEVRFDEEYENIFFGGENE